MKQTLLDKIWQNHSIHYNPIFDHHILFIDNHLIHEVTSPQAFNFLRENNIRLLYPNRTKGTVDHVIPTTRDRFNQLNYLSDKELNQVETLKSNCKEFEVELFNEDDSRQGIVHVIAPEQGLILPGSTIVCGDSHTSTHGAFGALAFGIGTSEASYVFSTQCLIQKKPKSFGIHLFGKLNSHVYAKDIILKIISEIGTKGGTGYVLEFFGDTIKSLSMEERMTICNMSIEAGAKAGLIAPDEITFSYLKDKITEKKYAANIDYWRTLKTDNLSCYDQLLEIDCSTLTPMITYGTNPESSISIDDKIPLDAATTSLEYMQLYRDQSLVDEVINVAFVGSCTNGRLSDLRIVAEVLKGKKIAPNVTMLIVPGSQEVKRKAEEEFLDKIFMDAGAEWREPGCSLCLGMNGDIVNPGELCISTSNRNFKGRQGPDSRTILASPYMVALAAVNGKITKPGKTYETN